MDETNSSIPRSRIFVLLDGHFVVKWSDNRVQELLTGQYRPYDSRDIAAAITDFELNQLRQAGIVTDFDAENVWIAVLPERAQPARMADKPRVRSYYLNTILSGERLTQVEDQLMQLGLEDEFHARNRDDFVIILGRQGRSFGNFDEAEEARHLLADQSPELFQESVVAFVETTRRD
jgi:hypothetical protein